MMDRTKEWIAQAMKRIMMRKPLDKVHVTDICQEAQMDRSTFYYHFKDKYDLVSWIFTKNVTGMDVLDIEEGALSLMLMRQDYLFYKRAYEDVASQNSLWKYLLEYFYQRYEERALELLGTPSLDKQMAYSLRLYCYGAVGMAREWFLTDNETPAREVIEMSFLSMPECLRSLFFSGNNEQDL